LFDAALAFGKDWRRDVSSVAAEQLPKLDEGKRATLAREVETARAAIEQWIWDRWKAVRGNWSESDTAAAREFVRATYPWMDDRNISHAVNQSTYYAWRG